MLSYRQRPSLGFVLLVAILAGSILFFAWGAQTPPLEEVWRMNIELGVGERPALNDHELTLLQESLLAHPKLADFLIEDKQAGIFSANDAGRVEAAYAYLIRRSARDPATLRIVYEGVKNKGAVQIAARTLTATASGQVSKNDSFVWRVPENGMFPQLIEVRLEKSTLKPDGKKRRHPVRIDWEAEL